MAMVNVKVTIFLCAVLTFVSVAFGSVIPGGINAINHTDLMKHTELLDGLKLAVRNENTREPKPTFKFVYLPFTLEASVQVVEGVLYRASVKIAPSRCQNVLNETREGIEECPVDFLNPDVLQQEKCCRFEIWLRAWLTNEDRMSVQKADCKPTGGTQGASPPRPFSRIRVTMKVTLKPQPSGGPKGMLTPC